MGLRDKRWSAMLKRRGQGVEVYLLGEAAWAGLSGLRQERFQASCDDPDTS